MNDMFYTADDSDVCENWLGALQQYRGTTYYTGFGWSGQFNSIEVDRGYWYYSNKPGYVTTPFNVTTVGVVPVADRSETIYNTSWSMLGWTSIHTKTLDNVLPSAADSDVIELFNAPTDYYKGATYYGGFGWFGNFRNIEPGRGYWYYSTNSTAYNWTYAP